MTDIAVEEYSATWWDMCIRRALLEMIEDKLDKFVDEEEVVLPEEKRPLPPTGGLPALAVLGTMLTGTGLLLIKHSIKQ